MRLLADENIVGLDALPEELEVVACAGRAIDAAMLDDVDALWVRSVTRVDATLLRGRRLRFVGTATAGVEHVDRAMLRDAGIPFAAAPGANAMAVVEYVLAALLALEAPWACLEAGGRLGIVGYGHVGRRLAAFAGAMGWSLAVCDPWVRDRGDVSGVEFVDLEELLRSDVISLHCSLHHDAPWPSYHLLDDAALARLEAGQWLVNASRGGVMDNAALLARLGDDGAPDLVLDVFEGEPVIDLRLLESAGVRLVTPHVAGYSWDAKWEATQRLLNAMVTEGLLEAGATARVAAPGPRGLPGAWPASAETPADLLLALYDPRRDDHALRALSAGPAASRGASFDRLRRDYPLRRELGALLEDSAARGDRSFECPTAPGRRFAGALMAARRSGTASGDLRSGGP